MKNLFFLLVILCFMSCEKEKTSNFPGPKGLGIVLINEIGENLFNLETENSIDFDKVQNLYLIDGEYVPQYHGNLDHPKLCDIFDSEQKIGNFLGITPSEHFNEEGLSTTVIDWGNGDSDTIVASMDSYTKLPYSEFWYNGILMEDLPKKNFSEENDDYYYEIQKEY